MNRFVIGKCRTGKIVTSDPQQDELATDEERFDAMALLEAVALKEYERGVPSELIRPLAKAAFPFRLTFVKSGKMAALMAQIGAKTTFDIQRYAQGLLRPEFRI